MKTIFTLSSARSGTTFLSRIIQNNCTGCKAIHEPYFNFLNPNGFGKPIEHYCNGNITALRKMMKKKARYISKIRTDHYLESNHAFLKSFGHVAMEFFSDMKLVHLIREPLSVAKSELNREEWINQLRIPFRNYRDSQHKKQFRWTLYGKEPIFMEADRDKITRLQFYFLQWIEIENRAMQFIKEYNKEKDTFTVHVPKEINNPEILKQMFEFLELKTKGNNINLGVKKNKTPGNPTIITDEDQCQFDQIIKSLPAKYLDIFLYEPYCHYPWAKNLTRYLEHGSN